MAAVENILLIRFKALGDVAFLAPAIHGLREAFPSAKITCLTSKEHAPMLEGFSSLDERRALDRSRLRSGRPKVIVSEILALLRWVRAGKFTLAVDFQGFAETGWLAWLSRAPQRWGTVYHSARGWAFTRGVRRDTRLHPIDRNLSLLQECGVPLGKVVNRFDLPPTALRQAQGVLESHGLQAGKPLLFIQPFTSTPSKNWPLNRQLAVARYCRQRGVQVLFGGGAKELTALEPVRQEGFASSAGTSLLVTAGLMKLSTVVLGGDTGILHLAVAMDKRVVILMSSTAPGSSIPFQHGDWAVTPPGSTVIGHIPTEATLAACTRAFNELGVELPN